MSDLNILFISIDSLRRDMLDTYDQPFNWVTEMSVKTPNLDRFAQKAATFDTHYAGSLPCMPARREWQTGTQEFLWRGWGPIESYDTTLAEAAREAGVLTQLVTDHFHLFQHGSAGYFEDYHGFEFIRGHEDDAWKTAPHNPDTLLLRQVGYELDSETVEYEPEFKKSAANPNHAKNPYDLKQYRPRWAYVRNTMELEEEKDFFAARVFSSASNWLDNNLDWKQWFLRIDEFDVHEPFHCPEPYASMYTSENPRDPDLPIWPFYGRTDKGQAAMTNRELEFVRSQFAGKVTMVDKWFGELLDKLDELELWDDTVVIVTSDHGFLLGEHNWVGKMSPEYNVVTQTPLMIWHPESSHHGDRISNLTCAVDLHATIRDILGAESTRHDHSQNLLPLLMDETDIHRDWVLYGWWGQEVNITDGEYTYMVPTQKDTLTYNYSTMQMNPVGPFTPPEGHPDAEAGVFLPYTNTPVWKYGYPPVPIIDEPKLFNITKDPMQHRNIAENGSDAEKRMQTLLQDAFAELEVPATTYERFNMNPGDT